MLKYILKLWTTNSRIVFANAVALYKAKKIDGIELYNNVKEPLDWSALEQLKEANVVGIHNPHSHGWHDFFLTSDQQPHWEQTKQLADYFNAPKIIVHPARTHTPQTFWESMRQLYDERVLIENMAGHDTNGAVMEFGQMLEDLQEIKKQIPICFDIEKATKSAVYQKLDYKKYLSECIEVLDPTYVHISGGDVTNSMDQHLDLWDGGIDWAWVKVLLEAQAKNQDMFVVFEIPKKEGLENDVKNMEYFRAL